MIARSSTRNEQGRTLASNPSNICAQDNSTPPSQLQLLALFTSTFQTTPQFVRSLGQSFRRLLTPLIISLLKFLSAPAIRLSPMMPKALFHRAAWDPSPLAALAQPRLATRSEPWPIAPSRQERVSTSMRRNLAQAPGQSARSSGMTKRGQSKEFLRSIRKKFKIGEFANRKKTSSIKKTKQPPRDLGFMG